DGCIQCQILIDDDSGSYNEDLDELKKLNNCPLKSLNQHDAEVRNKVIDELLEWADSKMMDWINSPKYREPHFRGTRIIHYYDLQQKLTELKGE
ncbi:MAG: hypothetical protein PHS54_06780, partial [Clostridia bacterium]|nr:hypothetical protein [Clostridia bacterium]